jgi:glycosyltransferase involved in cell wall biosynthesis
MFTNTYLPHVGGVAKSVASFAEDLRAMGHAVLIIAPTFPDTPPKKEERHQVLRVPAWQNFNGSDFSVRLPLPFTINNKLEKFQPDIIHSHHPFLIGDSALRLARQHNVPLVFTHHTLYERYTHYVPFDSKAMKRFVIYLSTLYANMCNRVIAPSATVAGLLKKRGVKTTIEEIPTGVDVDFFAQDQDNSFRKANGISEDTLVIGHLGRLAPEKNLHYLSEAVSIYLENNPRAVFLVVGAGPSEEDIRNIFEQKGLLNRLILAGKKSGKDLVSAYQTMDLFVFASKTETQGMVLTEAMAAGKPVIALDASGVREVVRDDENGRLLNANAPAKDFASAIKEFVQDTEKQKRWQKEALKTAKLFSRENSTQKLLNLYKDVCDSFAQEYDWSSEELVSWDSLLRGIKAEWQLISQKTSAAVSALKSYESKQAKQD